MSDKVIVTTGSRHWTDKEIIRATLLAHDPDLVVVGYNPDKRTPKGADELVYKVCNEENIKFVCEPADWSKGLGAGFARNKFMIDHYKPFLVVAFRAKGKSNGTDHCIQYARSKDIEVDLILQ